MYFAMKIVFFFIYFSFSFNKINIKLISKINFSAIGSLLFNTNCMKIVLIQMYFFMKNVCIIILHSAYLLFSLSSTQISSNQNKISIHRDRGKTKIIFWCTLNPRKYKKKTKLNLKYHSLTGIHFTKSCWLSYMIRFRE